MRNWLRQRRRLKQLDKAIGVLEQYQKEEEGQEYSWPSLKNDHDKRIKDALSVLLWRRKVIADMQKNRR